MRNRTVIRKAAAALVALVVTITIGACSGTPQVRSITLTFIRHAESTANAANVINTDIPGPSLTEEGQGQAEQLAHQLSRNTFDAVYASDMVRAQETAAPLAHALGKPRRPRRRWPMLWASRSKSCPVCGKSTPAGTTARRPKGPT